MRQARPVVRPLWILALTFATAASLCACTQQSNMSGVTSAQAQGSSVGSSGMAPSVPSPNCGEVNTPGGADPWGTCWPGPGNTGPATDDALQVKTGNIAITQPGYILEDIEVHGCITIAAGANDVLIRNVRVKGDCAYLILNDALATGLKVIDSELDGNSFAQNNAAVSGADFTLDRVNIHNVGDGIKAGSGVVIKDSFLHSLNISNDSHNDGIQSLDAIDLTIDHNTVILADGATSCIILSQNSGADWQMRNVNISRNLLAGGAYTIYGGYEAGRDDPLRASDIVVSDNRISTVTFPRGGAYGALTSVDPPIVTTVGNLWADGPNSGLLV